MVVEYPPLDLYTDPGDKPKRGAGIPAERARLYNLYYCDREFQKDAYASPVYATDDQLQNFPPTLIMTAGLDDLCTEAEDFGLHLARCGNEVTMKRVPGAGHAFTIYRKEKHEEGFELIVRYVKNLF
jgi:acetyl esterase